MDRTTELALASTYVYDRNRANRVGIPPDWQLAELYDGAPAYKSDNGVSFSAGAFIDDDGGIVFSFTGTNGGMDWLTGNLPSGLALPSPQIFEAIRFVSDVLARYANEVEPREITFTGHSLGAGLASVMAVFFGRDAHLFDPAPFQLSAVSPAAVLQYFVNYSVYQGVNGRTVDAQFAAYAADPLGLFSQREANVEATALSGEILNLLRSDLTNIYSNIDPIDVTASSLYQTATSVPAALLVPLLPLHGNVLPQAVDAFNAATELHSIDLLTLMLGSSSFRSAVQQSPRLMELMFSNELYGPGTSSAEPDFTARLVQFQFGVPPGLTGTDPQAATPLADRFGEDILRLGTVNALPASPISDAVIATLIEAYRFSSAAPAVGYVTATGTAAHIDLAMLPTSIRPLGPARLIEAAAQMVGPEDVTRVSLAAASARHWFLQNTSAPLSSMGTSGNDALLNFSGSAGSLAGGAGDDLIIDGSGHSILYGGTGNDVIIGGAGGEYLDGGADADYLSGGDGIDALYGGTGRDELRGGAGEDEYYFTSGDGSDLVVDSDGAGTIYIDGLPLAVGQRIAANTWLSADGGLTIERIPYGGHQAPSLHDLVIRSNSSDLKITIQRWQLDQLNINLTFGAYPAAGDNANDVVPSAAAAAFASFRESAHGDYLRWDRRRPSGSVIDRVGAVALSWTPNSYISGTGTVSTYQDMDNLRGSAGGDRMFGLIGNDSLVGGDGDDYLDGGADRDVLIGGLGGDRIIGGDGADVISGDANDAVFGSALGDQQGDVYLAIGNGWVTQFYGLGWGVERSPSATVDTPDLVWGATWAYAGGSGDVIDAGAGNDHVWADDGDDIVSGDEGDDQIVGGAGSDLIFGGAGADRLLGDGQRQDDPAILGYSTITAHGADEIHGGDGDDVIAGFGGSDELFGDDGADEIFGDGATGLVVPASAQGNDLLDGGAGNDILRGGGGHDTLLGGNDDDQLYGDADNVAGAADGDDFLDGGTGNDHLNGAGGDDRLVGGAGIDTLFGDADAPGLAAALHGDDHLDGGADGDTLVGGGGRDTLLGGDGADHMHGDQMSAGLPGSAQNDDYLDGGAGDDQMTGGGGADTLVGGAGIDVIRGDDAVAYTAGEFHGIDIIDAGDGADTVYGGGAGDVIHGGDGNDTLRGDADDLAAAFHGDDYISGDTGDDVIAGDGGDDQLYGGAGDDQIQGDNVADPALTGDDYIDGGAGNDILFGQGGNDIIVGSLGNDQIVGDDGDDELSGGEGNDTIYGAAGNDTLYGGIGSDYLDGGAGNDVYVFSEEDLRITENTTDTIVDLQGENQIVFRDGVTQQNVTLAAGTFSGSVAVLHGDGVYGLTVSNALSGSVRNYTFADGSSVAAHRLIGTRYGGAANQTSSVANSYLLGGTLNDTISGTGNGVTISGGRGNDTLTGGTAARTTYLFELGDGADTINDLGGNIVGGALMTNALTFGAGIDVSSLQLECTQSGVLSIRLIGTTDSIRLQRFSTTDALAANLTLDEFRFSSGTVLTWQQLVTQLGIDVVNINSFGSFGGTNVNDRIQGGAHDETISGQAGDDIVYGNGGNDTLNGGAGSDTYVYSRGHGNDVINNTDEAGTIDTLRFDATLTPAEITWYRYDDHLIGRISSSPDVIRINNFFTGALDAIQFSDGTTLTMSSVPLSPPQAQVTAGADVIYGSQLNDVIDALAGNDTVYAGAGDDTLAGGQGVDTLFGDAGNDTIDGGVGNDTLYGGAGNDTITDVIGSNTIYGEDGDDTLSGNGSMEGGAGNDTLTGGTSYGFLDGGTGNDILTASSNGSNMHGGDGNDTLITGTGGTLMQGGTGNDLYIYKPGSGANTITQFDSATNRMDVLRLGAGILPENVVLLGGSTGSLILRFLQPDGSLHPTDVLTLSQFLYYDTSTQKLDRIEFESAPGVFWTLAQIEQMAFTPTDYDNFFRGTDTDDVINALGGADTIIARGGHDVINGGAGVDTIYGGDGNDTLHTGGGGDTVFGEAGDDTLIATTGVGTLAGGQGNDTYLVERYAGSITINSVDFATADVLKLGTGISLSDTTYRRSGNHLVIRVYQSGSQAVLNQITISDYFTSIGSVIDQIRFVDAPSVVLSHADVVALTFIGDGSNETMTGTAAGDIMRGNGGNDTLNALDGDDDLDGGTGYDALNGGAGNDIYRFGTGSAEDIILDTGGASDRIELAPGITPAQVSLYRFGAVGGDSLALVLNGGNEQLLVTNHFAAGDAFRVEQIRFSNGVVWDAAYILANVTNFAGPADTQTGTGANDTFTVNHASDVIVEAAAGGTDTVNSYVYVYTLGANVENLNLLGPLNSRANGNELDNVLAGNAADNVLFGGAGKDTMSGGAGNDTYYVDQIFANEWSNLRHNNFQDIVVEGASGGIDTIYATTYSAIMPANVERLILQAMVAQPGYGPVGTDFRRKFFGNDLDNYIDLSGPSTVEDFLIDGGLGSDTMIGRGDDTYIVDNVGDKVIESVVGGHDTVESWVDYTLADGVEDLKLLGSADLDGTGNAGGNELRGNSGSNVLIALDGDDYLRGDVGNDTLIGGNGWDDYAYASTDGLDIIDNSATDDAPDRLVIYESSSAFTFTRSSDDLLISNNASSATNAVRVTNWFLGEQWQIDTVTFTNDSVDFTNEDITAMFEQSLLAVEPSLFAETLDEAGLSVRRLVDAMNHFGSAGQWVVDTSQRVQGHEFRDWLHAGIGERSRLEHHGRVAREAIA